MEDKSSQPKDMLQKSEMLKVMIADDDPPTRVLLRAAISQWGYTIVEAKDGEEAWDILQAVDAPRLLIIDWLMPRLDGVDLCRRIKQEFVYRPYIILLTQVAGTANIVKGLEAGADEFLSKPFNMAELRSRLSVGTRIIQYENELASQNRKLQNYASTMESLAQERARQLVHHTDMLVMLGSLVISISNEISTLVEQTASPGNNARVKELNDSLRHIVDVIKGLQADSKVYPHKIVACQFNDIIERALTVCQSPLQKVVVVKQFDNKLPPVMVDPEVMLQALIALFINISEAVKSQPQQQLCITTTQEGKQVHCVLEDSGLHLSQDEINSMFQSKLDATYSEQMTHQKRLNVALSKEILAKYNATITAQNNKDSDGKENGVRFIIDMTAEN